MPTHTDWNFFVGIIVGEQSAPAYFLITFSMEFTLNLRVVNLKGQALLISRRDFGQIIFLYLGIPIYFK